MRYVALYIILSPAFFLLFCISAATVNRLFAIYFAELRRERTTGTPLLRATRLALSQPLAQFHREGMERVRRAEQARRAAAREREATVLRHPSSRNIALPAKPQLTLILGGRHH